MRWITATNLEIWSESLSARVKLPELVSDLIRATAENIGDFRFPSGDKGQVRGFDGVLETTIETTYVPDGNSIWEFGLDRLAERKFRSDIEKRASQLSPNERSETSFVFVTLRSWDNPQLKLPDLIAEYRKKDAWKGVRYIDGIMLEEWLALCPAVAARWARNELGLVAQTGVRSCDEFWSEYSTRYAPTLVEDVLLAGRESQVDALLRGLLGDGGRLAYAADSPDEVIAFAVASIRRAEPSIKLFLEARALIVDTEEAARSFPKRNDLIFLPRGSARQLSGLLAQSGLTLISAGADEKRNNHNLLNRPSSSALGKAFIAMGFSEQEGYDIARRCGRSLTVLARQRPSGTALRPEWIVSAQDLLPALMAGAWNSTNIEDKRILSELANGVDYDLFESPLRRLVKLKDSPLDRVGEVWAMRSSIDAFVHLGHLIGAEHLRSFSSAALQVLSSVTPQPKASDVFRPVSERPKTYSDWLREGLMNMLLHMAVLHEQAEFVIPGRSPQDYVNEFVRSIPGLTSDHRLLASLRDNLALLAEAAPIPFLEALEHLLGGDATNILPIFNESKEFFAPHSAHVGVLWALETLAWDPALLLRVTTCLARLAEIDPGGNLSNRPINSLRSIFLSWSPNTDAPTNQRVAILTQLCQIVPSVAWPLLNALLPRGHDTADVNARPKFRENSVAHQETLTYGLVWESENAIVHLALKEAKNDPTRWASLIRKMGHFQLVAFEELLRSLEELLSSSESSEQLIIWDALQKEEKRHTTYTDADWALSAEQLTKVCELVEKFRPQDSLQQISWLFDDWFPSVPNSVESTSDPAKSVETARANAINAVFSEDGSPGLVNLLKKVKLPNCAITALLSLKLDRSSLLSLISELGENDESLDIVVSALINDGVVRMGNDLVSDLKTAIATFTSDERRIARLLSSLNENKESWEIVKSFGEIVNEHFWREKHPFNVDGGTVDLLFAIDSFAKRGRFLAGIKISIKRISEINTAVLIQLLKDALPEINSKKNNIETMTEWCIQQVFDALATRADLAVEDLAQLEMAYLPLLKQQKIPLAIHRLMRDQPSIYMEMICSAFKAAGAEEKDISDQQQQLASIAYDLLREMNMLPGKTENSIDKEVLLKWCHDVREMATIHDRVDVTDSRIGELLAHGSPSGEDGTWPHSSVREIIEKLASKNIEDAIVVARFNMRGVYSKGIGEGGNQERELAKQARNWASAAPGFPRTAAMLMRVADMWDRQATAADLDAETESLRR